ncbi:carbohydrate ABC transporter permease [Nocardiopsis sp. MG754419]|uniref:carbohydrate ABC transporter permease n=1 Tax=Nocardiopsis sp. MG754419 TaxID=2259865 RepID=UPI001BA8CB28|nr:sugar ABC transporter permease [Nocardiopsis sp. MG754419]MBR8742950.1 sugar ABC transporter permease [Nocardiopsis sp. MG754419]
MSAVPWETARGRPRRRRDWTGLIFFTPFLLVFVMGIVAPLVYASGLSLYRDQLIGGRSFVGLGNYLDALTDPRFLEGVSRVGLFLAVQVPVMIGLALLAALILDSGRIRAMRFMRIGVFMPYAVPSVVAALMWGFIYGDQFGLVGQFNAATGAALPGPLTPDWVLIAIGNVVTWQFLGYNMLILYAALRSIPEELYEAAAIDGAGEARIAWSVKIPALKPALWVATLFSIIGSFQLFNEPHVLQSLAPASISTYYTPNMYAYQLAFNANQVTYSAAVAILLGAVTVVVAYVAQWMTARGTRR